MAQTRSQTTGGYPPAVAVPIAARRNGELLKLLAPALLGGATLFCLDAGNVFDPAPLIELLRESNGDLGTVLNQQIFVSRCFTCHQLATAAETLLPPLAGRHEPGLALLLGIERLFVDEDLPLFERRFLFGQTLRSVAAAQRLGLCCLITYDTQTPHGWVQSIARQARLCPALERLPRMLEGWDHGTDTADLQSCA